MQRRIARPVSLVSAVWPGRPYPLGATWDGEGVNFALFSEHAQKVELCLFDAKGRRELQRVALARAHRPGLARLPARGAPGPALRLPRARPVRARGRGIASTRTSCCSTRTRRTSPGRCAGATRIFGYRVGGTGATTCRSTAATARAACRSAGWSTRRSPGATTGRRSVPWQRDGDLRDCTSAASPSAIPTCRRSCAAPTPGSPAPASIEYLRRLGVTAVELLPVHAFVDDRHLVERGLAQLLGLQHDRLLRARTCATPPAAQGVASSRRW